MAKIYGALEVAQLEWFTDAGKPAPASYIYRVIYVSDLKQVQVSDGTNWIAFLNTSTNQTLAGDITFTGAQIFSGQHRLSVTTNSSTGAIVALTATTPVIEFTGAVTSIAGIASGALGATVMLVNRSGNSFQIIDEGSGASASNRIRTGAGSITLTNNASVLLTYVGDNRWHVVGGSGSGSGAGGAKNYYNISSANANFAQNTVSPWSAATLTLSGGVPTGAPTLTATQMAIATTATNPILTSESLYNMQLTKSAANAQGQGFISSVLTIDREDVAKVLTGSFTYEVVSGTIDLSGTSTQSLEIWVYNVTANQWIQPAGFRGMNQSSGVGQVTFTFQTDGTPANVQYRVAVITAQTSTSAYVVNFNDFKIGPQTVPIVQLRNPAGTIIATGSLTPPSGYLYCDGTAISRTGYSELFAAIGTTYGVGDGSTTFNIPDLRGIFARGAGSQTISSINYSATLGTKQGDQFQGHVHTQSPSSGTGGGSGTTLGGSFVGLVTGNPASDGVNGTPRTGSETRPANQAVAYHICFSSGFVQTSSDTDTRVISFSGTQSSQAVTANVTNISFTATKDTHGAWNTNQYVVPVSGDYLVSASLITSGAGSLDVYRNGSRYGSYLGTSSSAGGFSVGGSALVTNCVAGDTLSIRHTQNVTLTNGYASFNRLSGPSVITATETVAARYTKTANQSFSAETKLTGYTRVFDTHSAWDSTNNLYRFPISGKWLIQIQNNSVPATTASQVVAYRINGIAASYYLGTDTTSNSNRIGGSTVISVNAGDYVEIYQFTNASTTVQSGDNTSFTITRLGN